jgi:CBS domain-containing protein
MIARDLVDSSAPFVTADADINYVARQLALSDCGAITVVDERLFPIGIITRSNIEAARAAHTPDVGEIPDFLLNKRRASLPIMGDQKISDVMTRKLFLVSEDTALIDIARLMENHDLKRLPVVEKDRLVGIVLRQSVLKALHQHPSSRAQLTHALRQGPLTERANSAYAYPAEISAEGFRALVAAYENAAREDEAKQARLAKEQQEAIIRSLEAQRLDDAHWRQMLDDARRAALAGKNEYMLIRFPAQLCRDGGRAINASDHEWPKSLRGAPADIFQRWRDDLHPLGFKIGAQIITFPDGLLGDAALFLMWSQTSK